MIRQRKRDYKKKAQSNEVLLLNLGLFDPNLGTPIPRTRGHLNNEISHHSDCRLDVLQQTASEGVHI